MNNNDSIRIMIVDDHQVVIDGIKLMLKDEENLVCVAEASTGREAIDKMAQLEVDLVLLDINLPDISGIEVCKKLSKEYDALKILALTMYDKGSFIQQMFKSGASGYILKNAGKEELLKAIKTINEGETYVSQQVSQALMNSLLKKDKSRSDFIPELTRREKEILQLIAQEYTTQEISKNLFISLNTVETHRKNLLSKFGVRNSVGLVRVAIEKGLLDG